MYTSCAPGINLVGGSAAEMIKYTLSMERRCQMECDHWYHECGAHA